MAHALRLARKGIYTSAPNPRVGCVLVRDGQVVGEGFHRRAGQAHAEVIALAAAGTHARGATAYVTLEPCRHTGRTPPCTAALIAAGVVRVIAAMEDPDPRVAGQGLRELAAAGIATECGLGGEAANALNAGFVSRVTRSRPLVRVKLAMSLDGRTAMASGQSQWITGPAARRDVQHWRAQSGAILTGIGTVLADDPALNVRPQEMTVRARRLAQPVRQPLRVVMDSQFRTPPNARLLQRPGEVLIAGITPPGVLQGALRERAELLVLEASAGHPSPRALLEVLARREVNDVLLEAGPALAGAFVRDGLVDELLIYAAPTLLGSGARPLLDLPGITSMSQQLRLELLDLARVGQDLRLRLRPQAGTATPTKG